MIHAGMGPTHINALFTTMNHPAISETSLHDRMKEVGKAIEKVAQQSCNDTAAKERQLTAEKRSISSEELNSIDYLDIAVSYDMMWLKRGRAHNSSVGKCMGIYSFDLLDNFFMDII